MEVQERKSKSEKKKKSKPEKSKDQERLIDLICHVCQEDMNQAGTYAIVKHCKEVHNCTPEIPCVCGAILRNVWVIMKHRRKCIRKFAGDYLCDLCGYGYSNKKHLEVHMIKRHTIGCRHQCQHCQKSFQYPFELRRHEMVHIPKELRELNAQCPYCEKAFVKKGRLTNHIKQVHSTAKDFICHICSKAFKQKGPLQVHIEATHATTADFHCTEPGCDVKCRSKGLLRTHMEVHAPKNIPCPFCPLMFSRAHTQKKHVFYIHTNADYRPFKCDQCDLSFKRKSDVAKHKFVHGPSDQFPCIWCDSSFNKDSNRSRHYRLYHSALYEELKKKKKAERFENHLK